MMIENILYSRCRFGSGLFMVFVFFVFFSCNNSDTIAPAETDDDVPPPANALFKKIPSSESNLHFTAEVAEDFSENIILNPNMYNGGGVGVVDFNKDGLQDLYFTSTTGTCKLYQNLGNMKFRDITKMAGVEAVEGYKTGVVIADVNGDSWPDIYVCRSGLRPNENRRNLLFINNWNNTFTESGKAYGIDDPSASNCANFFDYDLDGDLDLYVVNHPTDFALTHRMDFTQLPDGSTVINKEPKTEFDSDRLYQNNGNNTFTNISKKAGINNRAFGLSSIAMDWNGDNWPDIYVANDYIEADFLYINNKNGTFTEQADKSFRHLSNHTMGADVADINRDGLPDIFALDMLAEDHQRQKTLGTIMKDDRYKTLTSYGFGHQLMRNMLQLNNGPNSANKVQIPTFSEIGCMAGIFQTDWSWSVLAQDFDNDGWSDVFITNGYRRDVTDLDYVQFTDDSIQRKYGGIGPANFKTIYDYLNLIPSKKLRNYAYKNRGDLTFDNKTIEWGFTDKTFSNGAAYADLDNDGDLDLVVNNLESEALLYRNTAADIKKGAWLQLRFESKAGNPMTMGVLARVTAGGNTWQQELTPVRGFNSCNEPVLQFGFGDVGMIDKIEVLFPGGNKLLVLQNQPINQRLTLRMSDAKPGTLAPIVQYNPAYFNEITGSKGLAFTHQEDAYDDFDNERLLPWRLSNFGPAIAVGDVNGDKLEDFYIGGAAGSAGALFVQKTGGGFEKASQATWDADAGFEDAGSVFFDADLDGDADLFVASGGSSAFAGNEIYLQRLYINDGKGQYTRSNNALPVVKASSSAVEVFDYDRDGDLDVFLGGSCVPRAYPTAPASHVFRNDKGVFTDVTNQIAPGFAKCGMVRSIVFADLNKDQKSEMLVAGEWMPLTVFGFEGGKFADVTESFGLDKSNGFWRSLAVADFDGDGDLDVAAGNLGLNTRFTPFSLEPFRIYAKDFDGNGSIDPLMSYAQNGTEYPLALREKLLKQIPSLKKKFVRNTSYAHAELEDLYPRSELKSAYQLQANTITHAWFENQGGKFVQKNLPNAAQIAPAQAFVLADFNKDGKPDLLMVGNDHGQQVETGPIDAGNGAVLINDGKGNFNVLPAHQSGFWATKDARSVKWIRMGDGKKLAVVGNNNGVMQVFALK